RESNETVGAAVVAGILEMAWPESQKRSVRARRASSAGAALAGVIAIAWAVMPAITRAQDAIIATAALSRDLSPWGMYLNADPVVKAVLIGLALAVGHHVDGVPGQSHRDIPR